MFLLSSLHLSFFKIYWEKYLLWNANINGGIPYLLACLEHSPSSEANWLLASQDIRTLFGTQRYLSMFISTRHLSLFWARAIQSMAPSNLLKIHFSIILPSVPGSSKWYLSLRFSHQNRICISPPILATCPTHLILLHLITRKIFGEQYRSLSSLLCNFLQSPLPRPCWARIFSSAPYSQKPTAYVPPSAFVTTFHAHRQQQNYTSIYFNL